MAAPPEIAHRTVSIFEQATAANRHTQTRQGNVVAITSKEADDVMIAADLHGHRLNYERLLEVADLAANPRRHLVMQEVCHGGPSYPSGSGCMSHLLLEDVARLKTEFPDQLHFILSNHELAELTDFPITKSNRMLNLSFRCGLQEMYGTCADQVRDSYLEFLFSCPLAVRVNERIFISHSAPEDVDRDGFDAEIFDRPLQTSDLVPQGPAFRLVWGRDFRPRNAEAFASIVNADILIHGHEPCLEGFHVPNQHQIILDCCGHAAAYLILPTDESLSQQQVVARIQMLV